MTGDASIEEAAVDLGISPTEVIRLLESGQIPSHLGPDGRRRRVLRADLAAHREARFAFRQQRVQEERSRRWSEGHPTEGEGNDARADLDEYDD
jgi:excisionase family DNA binding protein